MRFCIGNLWNRRKKYFPFSRVQRWLNNRNGLQIKKKSCPTLRTYSTLYSHVSLHSLMNSRMSIVTFRGEFPKSSTNRSSPRGHNPTQLADRATSTSHLGDRAPRKKAGSLHLGASSEGLVRRAGDDNRCARLPPTGRRRQRQSAGVRLGSWWPPEARVVRHTPRPAGINVYTRRARGASSSQLRTRASAPCLCLTARAPRLPGCFGHSRLYRGAPQAPAVHGVLTAAALLNTSSWSWCTGRSTWSSSITGGCTL